MEVSIDLTHVMGKFIKDQEYQMIKSQVEDASDMLRSRTGPGSEFLGWLDLPCDYDTEELEKIKEVSEKIRRQSDVLIVIGIGGSYLGAKAGIDFLDNTPLQSGSNQETEVLFAGTQLSSKHLQNILDYIEDKNYSLNVITKSGTTIEPSIAYHILKSKLIEKYGEEEAAQRIIVTTDAESGSLRQEANEKSYDSFVIPDNIGGRFSVLTAVGLLPLAVAGYDIEMIIKGASVYAYNSRAQGVKENPSLKYAMSRNILYRKGYHVEVLANFDPRLKSFAEWWKQLYGESEGKDGKGIFPASVNYTTDLHSLGQYVQDGKRFLFETMIQIKNPGLDLEISESDQPDEGLEYLEGKSLNEINDKAMMGTLYAHVDGGVPVIVIQIDEVSEYVLGQLFFFFELAVGVSGYINAVNPFDQPGVEAYKENMYALLEKPGYEEKTRELKEKN
ncbi:MAG: glucose-6-phosphate isomerase [Atopococcus tabaci]|uniref:Glucose-6-phosphate isomerase n=1 Tax=Atopococcus tabaci TaxID=269774 RepID=A0AA43ZSD3_9LACT|nr:glucose-6-phosphate isomerase [Atopococcus tabaci]